MQNSGDRKFGGSDGKESAIQYYSFSIYECPRPSEYYSTVYYRIYTLKTFFLLLCKSQSFYLHSNQLLSLVVFKTAVEQTTIIAFRLIIISKTVDYIYCLC